MKLGVYICLVLLTAKSHANTAYSTLDLDWGIMKEDSVSLTLFEAGKSDYKLIISDSTDIALKAAEALNHYFSQVSQGISLHDTSRSYEINLVPITSSATKESFSIKNVGHHIIISGEGRGLLFGVYAFIEQYLGARKWAPNEPATVPTLTNLKIRTPINVEESPTFSYREVYSLASADSEYLDWHRLHSLNSAWGLWGHSMNKIVPAAQHFKKHRIWFAMRDGKRVTSQLCYSNAELLTFVKRQIQELIEANPDALYWSLSPNDGGGFCTCEQCSQAHEKEGSVMGTVLPFVNAIAEQFPSKQFSVLAYQETVKPPKSLRPAPNVSILLSNIEVYREKPVQEIANGDEFRKNLEQWKAIENPIYIWDYYTQFTNFLAPFPVWETFHPNLRYYYEHGISGIFAQLAGPQFEDQYALKSYLLAKLLWNPNHNVEEIKSTFLNGYYGEAGVKVEEYLNSLLTALLDENNHLDIYGNPLNQLHEFFKDENADLWDKLLEEAEQMIAGNAFYEYRIRKLRLALDYLYLQRTRYNGFKDHVIIDCKNNRFQFNENFINRVTRFIHFAKLVNVQELSENGLNLDAYEEEWKALFETGLPINKAEGAHVEMRTSPVEDFPARGWMTLVDGAPGFTDYAYNYLCFYGQPLDVVLDLGTAQEVNRIQLDFLEDQKHWITKPAKIRIYYSLDGKNYKRFSQKSYTVKYVEKAQILALKFGKRKTKARYIRVFAEPPSKFPSQLLVPSHKLPMIACSEIWVQ